MVLQHRTTVVHHRMHAMELLQIFSVIDNEQMVKVKHFLNEQLKGKILEEKINFSFLCLFELVW